MPQASIPNYALLLICLFVTGCSQQSMSQQNVNANPTSNPTIATVNGQPISAKVFDMYFKNGREALELDPNSPEGHVKVDKLREAIVSELIDRSLIRQEAERRSMAVPPDRLAAAERKAIAGLGGDERYDSYLAEYRLTRDEYKEIVLSEIYGELMRTELSKGLAVSDDDVKKFYQEHQKDAAFQLPERVTAAHILIAARPNLIQQKLQSERNLSGDALAAAVKAEMDKLRLRAETLRAKAAKGADFNQLARESSDDAGTRERGGNLGTFPRASHSRAFDDAAFAMKAGQVSSLVQTDFGFHIIKVFKRDTARAQTLAEATPDIRRQLLGKLEAQKLSTWLKDARRNATVRINEPYRFGNLKTEFP